MKFIFLLLLLFIHYCHFGQSFNVEIKNSKFVGHTVEVKFGNHYYGLQDIVKKTLTTEVKVIVVQKDENNETVLKSSATPLRLTWPKNMRILQTGGKLYISFQERLTTGLSEFKAAEVDTITMEIRQPKIIADFKKNGYDTKTGTGREDLDRNYFEWSPDSSKLLFFFSNERSCENVYISVSDKNLNVLWERMENLARTSDEVTIKRAVVDNNGNVYIAYNFVNTKKIKFTPGDKNHIAVYDSQKKLLDQKLDLGESQIRQIVLKISQKNNMLLFAGIYCNDNLNVLQGAFSGHLNLNDSRTHKVRKEPLPTKLSGELMDEGWAAPKKTPGVAPHIYPGVIELSDSSLALIGEFSRTETVYSGAMPTYVIPGSILYVDLNNEAPVFLRIPKVSVDNAFNSFNSYYAFAFKDKVIVFYNDKESNLKKGMQDDPRKAKEYRDFVLAVAIIDKNGNIKRERLADVGREYMALVPNIYPQQKNIFVVPFIKVKAWGGFEDETKTVRIEVK